MSTTTNLALNEPVNNSSGWDIPLNNNFSIMEGSLSGIVNVAITTTTTTLTGPVSTPNTSSLGNTQNMVVNLTGTLTANSFVVFPSGIQGRWTVRNSTSGSYTVTLKTPSVGATVTAPQGFSVSIYSDGTNIYLADDGVFQASANITFPTLTVTGNAYFATTSGAVGVGTTSLTGYSFRVANNITGATVSYGSAVTSQVQSGVTGTAAYYSTSASTQATAFTLSNLNHYSALQGSFGAGSTVTSQYGFYVDSTLTGGTNNYGFYGNIASGTNLWNIYMNGSAANYMNGSLSIGTTSTTSKFNLTGNATVTGDVGVTGNVTATNGSITAQGTSTTSLIATRSSTDAVSSTVNLIKSRGGNLSAPLAITSGDTLGIANFIGYGGTNNRTLSTIASVVDTYTSDANISSYMTFATSPSGSAAATEKLRIGSVGQLGIGGANYGTSGQVLTSGGATGAPSWSTLVSITAGTDTSLNTKTSFDFTGLPSTIRRITISLRDVSSSGTSNPRIQVLTGSTPTVVNSGYVGWTVGSGSNYVLPGAGFDISAATFGSASNVFWVTYVLNYVSSSAWQCSATVGVNTGWGMINGYVTASNVTGVRITTANGTDTFDAGSVNIIYE